MLTESAATRRAVWGLSPGLLARLCAALEGCEYFAADDTLQALFVDRRISPWRSRLPQEDSINGRVRRVIAYLLGQYDNEQQNVLLLLLHVLCEGTVGGLQAELRALANLLEQELREGPADPPLPDNHIKDAMHALFLLLESPAVRDAVIAFGVDFAATSERIKALDAYKRLHDLLHTVRYRCYLPAHREKRHFPDDPAVYEAMAEYSISLGHIQADMQELAAQPVIPAGETTWMSTLSEAHQLMEQALAQESQPLLEQSLRLLRRTLDVQPVRINARLTATARALRLPELVATTRQICRSLNEQPLDEELLRQFRDGVNALDVLALEVERLILTHDHLQLLDQELGRIESQLGQDNEELAFSWPHVKGLFGVLTVEPQWQARLQTYSQDVDSALARGDAGKAVLPFRRLFREVSDRFFRVDVDLRQSCERLQQVGAPLQAILKVMQ